MASVKFPQHDLPDYLGSRLSGASDTWDSDLAGALITADYFDAGSPTGGYIKVWDGASWVEKPVKVWSGSAWDIKPLKWWDGAAWQLT